MSQKNKLGPGTFIEHSFLSNSSYEILDKNIRT